MANITTYTDPSFIKDYLVSNQVDQKSRQTYSSALRRFVSWCNENGLSLGNLTDRDLLIYREYLTNQELSASTINGYISAVKSLFKWAWENEFYPTHIAQNIRTVKAPKDYRKDPFKKGEILGMIDTLDLETEKGRRDKAMILLMASTGLRTQAVVGITMSDFKTEFKADGTPVQLIRVQHKGQVSKDSIVTIGEGLFDVMMDYYNQKDEPTEFFFTSISPRNKGKALTTKSVRQVVREAKQRAGIFDDRKTAHSLRHFAATALLEATGDVQRVKTMLNHAAGTDTGRYTRVAGKAAQIQNHIDLI